MYTEAFKRLGYRFTYNIFPPQRGLIEADSGRVDGAATRVEFDKSLQKQFPNLIRVKEPVYKASYAAYSKNHSIHFQGWESLRGKDYIIGYVRGMKVFEKSLPEYVDKNKTLEITDIRLAIRMLASGRMDILLENEMSMKSSLRNEEFRGLDIRCIGSLDHFFLYPYLHKKHAELVPKLAAVLKDMKEDGSYEKIIELAENETDGK